MSTPHTVLELIESSAARLTEAGVAFGHGTATAFDEAAWLVLWSLGLPLDDLDDVADQLQTVETPFGTVRQVAPAARLSETPAHWELPAVPLGTHPARWSNER